MCAALSNHPFNVGCSWQSNHEMSDSQTCLSWTVLFLFHNTKYNHWSFSCALSTDCIRVMSRNLYSVVNSIWSNLAKRFIPTSHSTVLITSVKFFLLRQSLQTSLQNVYFLNLEFTQFKNRLTCIHKLYHFMKTFVWPGGQPYYQAI